MINKFERAFLDELAKLANTHGYVIVGDAVIDKASDWVDPNKPVEYTVEPNSSDGLDIESVDNVR